MSVALRKIVSGIANLNPQQPRIVCSSSLVPTVHCRVCEVLWGVQNFSLPFLGVRKYLLNPMSSACTHNWHHVMVPCRMGQEVVGTAMEEIGNPAIRSQVGDETSTWRALCSSSR